MRTSLGWQRSRSTIYRDMQAAGEAIVRRQPTPRRVQVVSADATYLICNREEIAVAIALDALAGEVIEVEIVDGESADALGPFLQCLYNNNRWPNAIVIHITHANVKGG